MSTEDRDDKFPLRYNSCPECGSAEFRRVESRSAHFVYDRICRDCETRYTPPTPKWMALTGMLAGVAICTITSVGAIGLVWELWSEGGNDPMTRDLVIGAPFALWFYVGIGWTGMAAGIRHFWGARKTRRN